MAMLSLKQGPSQIVDAIKLNHELINTPCVGTEGNFAFTSNQLNLAHVREWDSCEYIRTHCLAPYWLLLLFKFSLIVVFEAETLADNMGMKFGGAHIDQHDSPGHFTNMVALSDLPDGCDPGRFYIPYPGVFCTLHNFVSVNFSGLRVHGGSPPIAAEGTTVFELRWGTRCTIVSYAKTGPTTTEHKVPIVQLESDSVLSITPEMMRPG